MEIIFLLSGLVLGGAIAFLFVRAKFSSENKGLVEHAAFFENQLKKKSAELEIERNTVLTLSKELSKKEAEQKNINEKLSEQKIQLEKIQEQFRDEFKNLANKIFEEKSSKFTAENKDN